MPVDHEESITQRLTDAEDIYRVLKLLELQRCLITVALPARKGMASSMVLDVNTDTQSLIIDQLNDQPLQLAITPGDLLVFRAAYGGVQVSGECQFIETDSDATGPTLRLTLPTKVLHRQRRAAYRATIAAATMAITLESPDRKPLTGWVSDVSADGLGVVFDQFVHPPIEPGELFPLASFSLDSGAMEVALVAKHPNYDKISDKYRCGFSFHGLTAAEEKQLNQWVIQLQRRQRKQQRLASPRN